MSDLAQFLLDRIGEDEAAARELQRRAQDVQLTLQDPKALGRWIPGWHDWPDVEALTARVLAECEAKRRIVEEVAPDVDSLSNAYVDVTDEPADWPADRLLRLLAVPYADHSDYRDEWRP